MARAIDAENAIKKLEDIGGHLIYEEDGKSFCITMDALIRFINNLPTIDPVKQEWISVKDGLPEKGKSVLVYWDDGFDIGEYVGGEVGDDVYWMPLPEPPKEE